MKKLICGIGVPADPDNLYTDDTLEQTEPQGFFTKMFSRLFGAGVISSSSSSIMDEYNNKMSENRTEATINGAKKVNENNLGKLKTRLKKYEKEEKSLRTELAQLADPQTKKVPPYKKEKALAIAKRLKTLPKKIQQTKESIYQIESFNDTLEDVSITQSVGSSAKQTKLALKQGFASINTEDILNNLSDIQETQANINEINQKLAMGPTTNSLLEEAEQIVMEENFDSIIEEQLGMVQSESSEEEEEESEEEECTDPKKTPQIPPFQPAYASSPYYSHPIPNTVHVYSHTPQVHVTPYRSSNPANLKIPLKSPN